MDTFSKSERSKIMRQVRSGGTGPEMWVRRALHAAGFRFRLHDDKLPGKPDVVLRRYKTAVFVNGCLWHWHGCPRSRMPATNTAYWRRKFDRTVKRDAQNVVLLQELGWNPETLWECELKEATERLISNLVSERQRTNP